jgi:hypothetical protein
MPRSDTRPLAQWSENPDDAAALIDYYFWETDANGWTLPVAFGNMAATDNLSWTQVDLASIPAGWTELDTMIREDGMVRFLVAT